MSVHCHVSDKDEVITMRVRGPFNLESARQCLNIYNGIPRVWWKKIVIVLDHTNEMDITALELLFFLRERSCGGNPELQLEGCGMDVHRKLEAVGGRRYFNITYPRSASQAQTRLNG